MYDHCTAGDGKKTTLVSLEPVMTQSQLQLKMKNSKIKCKSLLHKLINLIINGSGDCDHVVPCARQ